MKPAERFKGDLSFWLTCSQLKTVSPSKTLFGVRGQKGCEGDISPNSFQESEKTCFPKCPNCSFWRTFWVIWLNAERRQRRTDGMSQNLAFQVPFISGLTEGVNGVLSPTRGTVLWCYAVAHCSSLTLLLCLAGFQTLPSATFNSSVFSVTHVPTEEFRPWIFGTTGTLLDASCCFHSH